MIGSETVTVVKKGSEKQITIDDAENKMTAKKIVAMLNKDNCYSMFQKAKIDKDTNMYQENSHKAILDYRFNY